MAEYKFSVGAFALSGSELDPVGVATGITISYDGAPVEFRGGDYRLPLAIELGDESIEITIESSKFDIDGDIDTFLSNNTFTLTLSQGANSGGMIGTIENCKLVGYEVVSEQAGFVLSTITVNVLDSASTGFTKNIT